MKISDLVLASLLIVIMFAIELASAFEAANAVLLNSDARVVNDRLIPNLRGEALTSRYEVTFEEGFTEMRGKINKDYIVRTDGRPKIESLTELDVRNNQARTTSFDQDQNITSFTDCETRDKKWVKNQTNIGASITDKFNTYKLSCVLVTPKICQVVATKLSSLNDPKLPTAEVVRVNQQIEPFMKVVAGDKEYADIGKLALNRIKFVHTRGPNAMRVDDQILMPSSTSKSGMSAYQWATKIQASCKKVGLYFTGAAVGQSSRGTSGEKSSGSGGATR